MKPLFVFYSNIPFSHTRSSITSNFLAPQSHFFSSTSKSDVFTNYRIIFSSLRKDRPILLRLISRSFPDNLRPNKPLIETKYYPVPCKTRPQTPILVLFRRLVEPTRRLPQVPTRTLLCIALVFVISFAPGIQPVSFPHKDCRLTINKDVAHAVISPLRLAPVDEIETGVGKKKQVRMEPESALFAEAEIVREFQVDPAIMMRNRATAIQLYQAVQSFFYDTNHAYSVLEEDWRRIAVAMVRHNFDRSVFQSTENTYDFLRYLVASLNDPYSEFMTPKEYRMLLNPATVVSATADTKDGASDVQISGPGVVMENIGLSEVGVGIQFEPVHKIFDPLDPPERQLRSIDDALAPEHERDHEFSKRGLLLAAPVPESSAEKNGVRLGHRLVAIDGADVSSWSLTDAAIRLRGPPGTTVQVTLLEDRNFVERRERDLGRRDFPPSTSGPSVTERNEPSRQIQLTLTRSKNSHPSIYTRMLGSTGGDHRPIGYIRIHSFSPGVTLSMQDALESLINADCESLVLDLRNNTGGILQEALVIASMFFQDPKQNLIITKDSYGILENHTVHDQSCGLDSPEFVRQPVVVLTNGATASSSEVVAVALQENQRATLVGTRTFGKGLVQHIFPLPDESALKLSIAEFFAPNGLRVNNVGIKPDQWCDANPNTDNGGDQCIQTAIHFLSSLE